MRHRIDSTRRFDRRAVLLGSAALGGFLLLDREALASPHAASGGTSGLVVGPGRRASADGTSQTYHLSIVDLDADEPTMREIPLDFFGHGVTPDPTQPARACIFEKRGTGAAEVDLSSGEVLAPIVSPKGREFYGHGAFSPDGALLYSTETLVDEDYRGLVVVRDGRSLKELGEFPTFGESPHDCVLRDEGKTLVITNGGGQDRGGSGGSVSYVDVATEKLIEKVEIESPALNAGHLAISAAGDLAVVSAARDWMPKETLGGASFRPRGGAMRTMTEPAATTQRMIGESLSLAIHEATGTIGITNPRGSLVTFWNLRRGEFLGELALAEPRGIALTLDQRHFVVSYGRKTSLIRVDPESLEPVNGSRIPETGLGGSHILVHRLAPTNG